MTSRPRLLLTGATGLLGPYLVEAFSSEWVVITAGRNGADIQVDFDTKDPDLSAAIDAKPDCVLHCAALTDVDLAEAEPERAYRMNGYSAKALTNALPAAERLVFLSTDQVYPDGPGLHKEQKTGPVNTYGMSKLMGEEHTLDHARGLVLRVNFFGPSKTPGRQSLSDSILERLRAGKPTLLFDDVLFSPLHIETLAELAKTCVASDLTGAYNLSSRDGMSKADFAIAACEHTGVNHSSGTVGSSETLAQRAPRPHDMRMDPGKLEKALGMVMPTLSDEIRKL